MASILEAVESAIKKIENNKQPTAEESLALSFYLGGENTLRITRNVKAKIMDVVNLSHYRNKKTITSLDGRNYIVGETIPFNITKHDGEIERGKAIINIELLVLESSNILEGENPIEILMNLPNDVIVSALRNNESKIKKEPIKADNKDELLMALSERLRMEESELVFYIKDMAILTYKDEGEMKMKVVTNLFNDSEVNVLDTDVDILDNMFI